MNKEVSSKILDDAREKIIDFLDECVDDYYRKLHPLKEIADQILAISGTTDIECPDEATGDPDFATKTQHKWKVSVTLKNGELPEPCEWAAINDKLVLGASSIYKVAQQDMLNAEYRQVVE